MVMTQYFFSGRKPALIPPLKIPGSCIEVPGRTVNIMDHHATEYRALGTSIIVAERALYGPEIAKWSFGYDIGPQIEEDLWPQFKRWKEITETPQTVDVVPAARETGYMEGAREKPLEAGLFVHDSRIEMPINKTGFAVSKAGDVKYDLTSYLNTEEGQLFNQFMSSKGYGLRHNLDWFVFCHIPKNAIAAVHTRENFLAFNRNFRDMIARASKAHGVDYEDEKSYTILHELIHLYGVYSEEQVERLAMEFYSRLANKEPSGYIESVPKTIRSERERYLSRATIPRMRLAARGKSSAKSIEAVVEQLYAEAKDKGLSRDDAEQYANLCMDIYMGEDDVEYDVAENG